MSDYEFLKYREEDRVGYLTLDRPDKINALTVKMSDELFRAILHVRDSRDLRALVIKGAGGNFCAGDDLTEMFSWGDCNDFTRRAQIYQQTANILEDLDKITICAVDGYAVGGGLEITMACDFVIATERARWGMPEVDWGITPGWGGTTRLARLIGRRLAKEINMIGALHPAKKAVELHLWNRVVANDKLDEEVQTLLAVLGSKHQQGLRQLKLIINKGVECDLYTAQGFEALSGGFSAAVNGLWRIPDADHGRGLEAFATKNELAQRRRNMARNFWVD
ncbi:MAG TPA: enoyl-CoA hydratase/isomerase family protein [Xanthobacteraceae bacterium]